MSTATTQVVVDTDHESIVNDAPKFHDTFKAGDVSHQGDLIVVGIKSLPKSRKTRPSQQLADGNTQGSRHILREGIEVYDCDPSEVAKAIKQATKCDVSSQYIGPVFVSPDHPTENDMSHPEHGNQGFAAGSICAVVYQRNLDAEEQEQRTRD